MVMAQSLLKVLAARTPAPEIHVLAPPHTHPLLAHMPEVDQTLNLDLGHGRLGLGRRRALGHRLRGRYTQAIVLPNSFKSALIPWWAGIPRRTGWRGERRGFLLDDLRVLDPLRLPTTVQRFVALGLDPDSAVERVPLPHLEVEVLEIQRTLHALGLSRPARRRLLALCPGAEFGPAKQWPADHFGRLARAHLDRGWAVWLLGSAGDRAVCAAVNAHAGGGCLDLGGRTSLGQAVDLLALADRVVSNDSGLMHVAAALNRPLAALFGSTDPGHTPPLGRQVHILREPTDCAPCFRRECPKGHLDCLRRLRPERVLAAFGEA